ncbi:hypothetical protein Q7P37_001048 [Cladosporium fusiforme]
MANPSDSTKFWSNISLTDNVRAHLGDNYNYGASEDQRIFEAVVESLRYPEMETRSRSVPDAGQGTLSWIFADVCSSGGRVFSGSENPDSYILDSDYSRDTDGPWSHTTYHDQSSLERAKIASELRKWLKAEDKRILWVSGKPGSGKSTLMKFLRDQEETEDLLYEWANGNRLVIADHFFWLPGTMLQNSVEGLLRTLLCSVLGYFTVDLASAKSICTRRRWNLQGCHRPWSLRELKQTMLNIGTVPDIRAFFLIDGLDECCPQHLHHELMDTILECLQLPCSKICISSRPWEDFESRLDGQLTLRIDSLTRLDMLNHAKQVLGRAASGQRLSDSARKEMNEVIRTLVHRASGVFLWVELVLRAMQVEIKKCRGVQRLQTILDDHPLGLDEYFAKFIYGRITATSGNVSDTASVLKLALLLHSAGGLIGDDREISFIPFWLLSCGKLSLPIVFPSSYTPRLDAAEVGAMLQQTRAFLHQSCNDLLVLSSGLQGYRHGDKNLSSLNAFVQFFHRTVFDFLSTRSNTRFIDQGSPEHFDEPNFIPTIAALIFAYKLRGADSGCGTINHNLKRTIDARENIAKEQRQQYQVACERFAIEHLSCEDVCLGSHDALLLQGVFKNTVIPHNVRRAIIRHWPYLAICDDNLFGAFDSVQSPLARARGKKLCQDCMESMYDCINCGLIPSSWLDSVSQYHYADGRTYWISSESERVATPLDTRCGMLRTRPKDDAVEPEDSACTCELCGIILLSSKDCGLMELFLGLEYGAYMSQVQAWDHKSTHRRIARFGKASHCSRLLSSMPFDLPSAMQDSKHDAPIEPPSEAFQAFVWRRQKLKAVNSLLRSVHKQIRTMSSMPHDSENRWDPQNVTFKWKHFLCGFAPDLNAFLKIKKDMICLTCGANGKDFGAITICLVCDGFPRICQQCFGDSVSVHERDTDHSCFSVRLGSRNDEFVTGYLEDTDVVDAVMALFNWYVDNAEPYGLGYTVPSYVAVTLRKLEYFKRYVTIFNEMVKHAITKRKIKQA